MKIAAMIVGIVGSFIAVPSALFSGAFAEVLSNDRGNSHETGYIFLAVGMGSAFIASILLMRRVRIGLHGLILALVFAFVTCLSLNPLAIVQALLLFIASILAYFAVREDQTRVFGSPPRLH